jgi:sec-independent protein translocase protein TatC
MKDSEEQTMPFLEHLGELRKCLLHTLLAIFVTSIICYTWSNYLFQLLSQPIRENFQGVDLIGTGPAEAFIVKLKVALVAGVIISSPFSFLKLWHFISPGLYDEEKSLALPFVAASTTFFLIGVSFCYFLILPFAFRFFQTEFQSISIAPQIKIGEYLSFTIKLLFVFGLAFEMPVLTFILAKLKLISSQWLIDKARYAIICIFVAAAILTPPDVITQVLLALPLTILYATCIGIARLQENKSAKKAAEVSAVNPTE